MPNPKGHPENLKPFKSEREEPLSEGIKGGKNSIKITANHFSNNL
ncbi:hypothetical protein [Nostoc sp.]